MSTRSLLAALGASWLLVSALVAEEPTNSRSTSARLEAAKQQLVGPEYELRYKMQAGEILRHKVVHLVTIETKIKGTTQTARTRSISTKVWKVRDVDERGNITLVHQVDDVDMSSQLSGRLEVRYNSQEDEKAPLGYEDVADSLKVPLSTVTIDPHGIVIKREDHRKQLGMGGQIVAPLPAEPVKIGTKWYHPQEIAVKLQDGTIKRISTRQQYRLENVKDGIAEISIHTQILTPIDDPQVKVQLVQRLSHGSMEFDLESGRVRSQQLELNETVIGFSGPESIMQYVGKFTEEIQQPTLETAAKPKSAAKDASTPPSGDSSPQDPAADSGTKR